MFTDRTSRLMRPYGLKKKSNLPSMVERYIADMGQPCAFRADGEFTSGAYVRICDCLGIRRENTAPGTLEHNAPAESSIWRAAKAGHTARMEISRLFPGVKLEVVKNVHSANGGRQWLEAILWGAECMNRSATTANADMMSPHEACYGSPPELKMLEFFQPGYMRVVRDKKSQSQTVARSFLNGGYDHPSDCFKVLKASTGAICCTRDVTWAHPRTSLVTPPLSAGGRSTPPAAEPAPPEMPDMWYVPPYAAPPGVASPPTAAPPNLPAFPSPPPPRPEPPESPSPPLPPPLPRVGSPPPPPPPPSSAESSPATPLPGVSLIRQHVVRELGHYGEMRMPVRTRGQSRAIREGTGPQAGESEEDPNHYLGSLSMMGRAAFVSMMAEHEDIEAALRNDRPLRDPPYLSVYHASDLKTPTSYAEAMTLSLIHI